MGPAVEDDGGGVPTDPGTVGLVHRRSRVRRRGMLKGEPDVGDPGGLCRGGEEEETGGGVGAEDGVGDDEGNLTSRVEERRAHLVGGERSGQPMVDRQGEQE